MPASVHRRAVGRCGLGSPATQLMRAVRPQPPGWEIGPSWLRPASAGRFQPRMSRRQPAGILLRTMSSRWFAGEWRKRGWCILVIGGAFGLFAEVSSTAGRDIQNLQRQVFAGFEVGGASVAGVFWPAQGPLVSMRARRRRLAGRSRAVGYGVAGVAQRGLTNACS